MWSQEKEYAELMKELWGSPSRWTVGKKCADVATRLEVGENTVRNRLRRMRESGFLLGWRLLPNPQLLGFSNIFLYPETGSRENADRAIERLVDSERRGEYGKTPWKQDPRLRTR